MHYDFIFTMTYEVGIITILHMTNIKVRNSSNFLRVIREVTCHGRIKILEFGK